MIVEIRMPAGEDEVFAPDAFASAIGDRMSFNDDAGRLLAAGTLLGCYVPDSGSFAILKIDVDTRAGWWR